MYMCTLLSDYHIVVIFADIFSRISNIRENVFTQCTGQACRECGAVVCSRPQSCLHRPAHTAAVCSGPVQSWKLLRELAR